ncbi:hypothetical protein E2562_003259 [Oryza meyeriana var. granulata]|uniref:Uncharacterized protein n=1 Tax=Oryza meyeriana var. granulata TaxID=110450 RepID=A0A6G1EUY8_9ORYZ|nr:hypothetical protein E2562_003259 [Oryza meyeriana var. granulata]
MDEICELEGAPLLNLLVEMSSFAYNNVFIEVDRCMASGSDIAGSFADGCMMEGVFVDAFATFLLKEEMRDMPQTYGKPVFTPTTVANLLNIKNITRNGGNKKFVLLVLADHLRDVLCHVLIKGAKLIILPVLNNDH